MGGKLLTSVFNLPERRISREEYEQLRLDVIYHFKCVFPYCRIDTPKLLNDKDSAGDLDIIVNLQSAQVESVIKETWKIKPHHNGNVLSLPINSFQVDIIYVDNKYFQSTLNFFNYGDCSNLMGRIANFQGLNFGTQGLFFKLLRSYFSGQHGDVNPLGKIYITDSIYDILTFLGLDYSKWISGFDSEDNVFEFIESSPYFNPRAFFFDELNHENRSRNKNRPMYCRFVDRIAEKYKDQIIPRLSKQYWFPRVIKKWPHVLDKIEEYRPQYERQYIISKKWNGDIIKEIPLTGKDLGKFIISFKKKHEPFLDFIIENSIDNIRESVKVHFSVMKVQPPTPLL